MKTLHRQVSLIERTFINFPYDPTGAYSDTQLLNASSYILLTHAEIETYIEDRASELLKLADSRWKKQKKPCRTLMAACVYFSGSQSLPKKHAPKNDVYGRIITNSIKTAMSSLGGNHGIREKNFIKLFQMVGYEVDGVDPLLIAELEAIGSLRGEHAHKSSKHHLTIRFDPFAIKTKIANLLLLLNDFDADYSKFRKQQFGH